MGLTLVALEWLATASTMSVVSNSISDVCGSSGIIELTMNTLEDLDNLDLRPKIRPVMDLSAVEETLVASALLDTGIGYNAAVGLSMAVRQQLRPLLLRPCPKGSCTQ